MEKKEYERPKQAPQPYKRERLTPQRVHRILDRKKMEDDEMREVEHGQYFGIFNFLKL